MLCKVDSENKKYNNLSSMSLPYLSVSDALNQVFEATLILYFKQVLLMLTLTLIGYCK